jgi:hypothetical protein
MAEEKKAENKTIFPEVVGFLIALLFLGMVVMRIEQYLEYLKYGGYESIFGRFKIFFFLHIWPLIKLVAFLTIAACLGGIIHAVRNLRKIKAEDEELYGKKSVVIADQGEVVSNRNEKWEKVVEHINSPNTSDWRLAIIEADIILEDLLRASGYHGETIGDMLKAVEKSDFTTIESAWAAHKVRNQIAHSGSEFLLNEREAKIAIAQYESVFKEFKII